MVAAFLGIASINLYMLRERRSGSARSVRYGYQEESDEPPSLITRVLRVLHYFGKRDLFSFLLALMALAGVLPLALPIFGTVASVAFVPAAVKASLRAWRRSQQVRIARSEAVDAS